VVSGTGFPLCRCRAFASSGGRPFLSVSFVVKLIRVWRRIGRLDPKPGAGRRHSKLDPHRAFLLRRIGERDDMTMPELSAELAPKGTHVDLASISRWFIRNRYRSPVRKRSEGG